MVNKLLIPDRPEIRRPLVCRGTYWHVRYGSKADISAKFHVRFTPESGLLQRTGRCPLWAKSGHHLIRPTPPRASGELAGSL